jgi:DeoR/GlpR family transcriptional regulator of sugar metabolism
MMRAEINSEIISRSPQTFILTDASKFGRIALSRYCGAEDIEYLITDQTPAIEYKEALEKAGVKLLIPEL